MSEGSTLVCGSRPEPMREDWSAIRGGGIWILGFLLREEEKRECFWRGKMMKSERREGGKYRRGEKGRMGVLYRFGFV